VKKVWSDVVGLVGAGLCLIHCLVLPIILSASLFQGTAFLHYSFVFLSLLGAFASFGHSKNFWIKISLVIFFIVLLFGSIFEAQVPLVLQIGIYGLVITHLINIYLVRAGKNKKALAIS